MNRKRMIALALVLILSISALASTALAAASESGGSQETQTMETPSDRHRGKHGGEPPAAEPENAVGKDAAEAKAFSDAGVTEEQVCKVRSRVSKLDDGTVIYKVSFTCDGQRYSYQINAISGDVIGKNTSAVTESAEKTRRQGKRSGKKTIAEPENAIGRDAAKAKALEDAGAAEEQTGKVKAHVSQTDDGTVVYKVRFTFGGQRYCYRIDAISGDVVDKTVESAAEDAAAEQQSPAAAGAGEYEPGREAPGRRT